MTRGQLEEYCSLLVQLAQQEERLASEPGFRGGTAADGDEPNELLHPAVGDAAAGAPRAKTPWLASACWLAGCGTGTLSTSAV